MTQIFYVPLFNVILYLAFSLHMYIFIYVIYARGHVKIFLNFMCFNTIYLVISFASYETSTLIWYCVVQLCHYGL